MTPFYDCHTHTSLSSDCVTPMKDMALAAKRAGLAGICFTEHIDIGFPLEVPETVDPALYHRVFDSVRQELDFPLFLGAEQGFEYGRIEDNLTYQEFLRPDAVICSVHSLDGMTLYCNEMYDDRDRDTVYGRYLQKVLDSATQWDQYDILGHIGFVAKKSTYADPCIHYREHREILDAILTALVQGGHALEVNTSGLRNTPDTLPERDILRRYLELGGELITLGSDAHTTEFVGYRFREVGEMLRSLGVKYLTHYEKRKPVPLPL